VHQGACLSDRQHAIRSLRKTCRQVLGPGPPRSARNKLVSRCHSNSKKMESSEQAKGREGLREKVSAAGQYGARHRGPLRPSSAFLRVGTIRRTSWALSRHPHTIGGSSCDSSSVRFSAGPQRRQRSFTNNRDDAQGSTSWRQVASVGDAAFPEAHARACRISARAWKAGGYKGRADEEQDDVCRPRPHRRGVLIRSECVPVASTRPRSHPLGGDGFEINRMNKQMRRMPGRVDGGMPLSYQ